MPMSPETKGCLATILALFGIHLGPARATDTDRSIRLAWAV
jgi:hypothetical protein